MGPEEMVWVAGALAVVALAALLRHCLSRLHHGQGSTATDGGGAASLLPPATPVAAPGASAEAAPAPTFPPPHPSDAARLPLKRQVFISHTGQDGGAKTFAASILRPALEAAGLAVCMDFVSLEPGCKWPEELVGAAANSMVVVVVLSKSYTKRFWCMLELDLALHSHHLQQEEGGEGGSSHSKPLVIPVFYDSPDEVVDATSVRQHWSAGNLSKRLKRDEELGPEWVAVVDVPRWADNVVAMTGHRQNLRRTTGTSAEKDEELQLARRVVKAAVRHIPSLVDVGVEVVGFEEQEAALAAELGGPERLGVWLYGQGGRGKSTLAKVLFNRLAGSFPHSAFVEIQEGDGADKTVGHVAKALDDLGGARGSTLQGFVSDRKVLLVLDNVWTASQLAALLPTAWGAGSTVIVTSRSARFTDSDAWRRVQKRLHQHEVAVLDEGPARQLFRRAAGLEGGLDARLQCLEEGILRICGGLPLALQLLGGQLFEDSEVASWQGALAALQQGSPVEGSEGRLKGVLLHSLAGLDPVGVNMFLDAATIMRGWSLVAAKYAHLMGAMEVWTAWHGPAAAAFFKELTRRCLLGVDSKGELVVHDVLVVLGQGVVLSETPGLEGHWGSRMWWQGGKMVGRQQGQKVLAAILYGIDESAASEMASSPDLSEACFLLMRGAWPGHGLATLRVLNIYGFPGAALPEAFTQLNALRSLSLKYGRGLTALPESFGQLTALRTLEISASSQLTALPGSFGRLAALQSLDLSWCKQLTALPESFGQLVALHTLGLAECKQLTALPESFGRLAALQTLDLQGCQSLAALPDLRVGLGALRELDIRGCTSLVAMPAFNEHPHLQLICDGLQLAAAGGEGRAWFGRLSEGGCSAVAAPPTPGCWVAEWRVRSKKYGVASLQGVLNDGTPLLPLEGCWHGVEAVVVEGEGGCFTEVHGRATRRWGLEAFMGCGAFEGHDEDEEEEEEEEADEAEDADEDVEEWEADEEDEAWTFKCPPGHRIVGYAGSVTWQVDCVCFLTAEFRDPDGR